MAVAKLPPGLRRRADAGRAISTPSMEIERASFRSPWSAQMLLEEMARDWAQVDVVRDPADRRVRRLQELLAGRRRGPPAEHRDPPGAAPVRACVAPAGPHHRPRARPRLPPGHAGGTAVERRGAAALPAVRVQAGRHSPELLRGGSGGRDRDAAGSGVTWPSGRWPGRSGRPRRSRGRRRPFERGEPGRAAGRCRWPPPAGGPARGDCGLRPIRHIDDARAGGRDHVRRLRHAHAGLRLRPAACSTSSSASGSRDDLRLRPLGRGPPRRDDRAGERAADRVRRSLVRAPAHVAAAGGAHRRRDRSDRGGAGPVRQARGGVPPAVRRLEPAADRRRAGSPAADGDLGRRLRRSERADHDQRHDPRGARPGARRLDHHLSHQRPRLEDRGGAARRS